MPEEINRMVADLFSFGVPSAPAHEEVAPEFGFGFVGIRAIEPLGFLEFLQPAKGLARTDSGGGAGKRRAFRELWSDAAGEHGEAGGQVE